MPRGKKEEWDEEMMARAAGLKRAGFSIAMIAERLGVSVGSVRNRLLRAGAKVRLTGTGGRGSLKYGRRGLDVQDTIEGVIEMLGTSEGIEQ